MLDQNPGLGSEKERGLDSNSNGAENLWHHLAARYRPDAIRWAGSIPC
jgi:hypothetical protein